MNAQDNVYRSFMCKHIACIHIKWILGKVCNISVDTVGNKRALFQLEDNVGITSPDKLAMEIDYVYVCTIRY